MDFKHKVSGPATSRSAVVFCCDDGYLPYALHAANQISQMHPNRDFDLCVVSYEAITIPEGLRSVRLRTCTVDAEAFFALFPTKSRHGATAYARLLVPSIFQNDYDRILYLDSDIHIQSCNLSGLLRANLDNRAIAAVRDNPQWRTPTRKPSEFKKFDLPNAPYFNSGVLLIDVRNWQKEDILGQSAKIGRTRFSDLERHDQTLLNVIFHRKWAELSPVWNWQYSASARLHEAVFGANIIHFIGPVKPWNAPPGVLPPRFGRELANFCAVHFPERKITVPTGTRPGSSLMFKMLLRHMINRKKMERYLARFPTELIVAS
ncbi:glycosyltransferase family 8 protein [Sedimentimonas flavescens]|uniref:Glycosyltransferase family 8 protein n=1 Tax=Sedimentimonas flavescens TaxID=2851012 RepID=A0ABT3A010_9RHOB|nr:glycosyltransferase family 8 protein [Sedimentimonas flavescens]MCV2878880.1 glycosyltransferase family 8 protein [Sedimentimonas flavescens]